MTKRYVDVLEWEDMTGKKSDHNQRHGIVDTVKKRRLRLPDIIGYWLDGYQAKAWAKQLNKAYEEGRRDKG